MSILTNNAVPGFTGGQLEFLTTLADWNVDIAFNPSSGLSTVTIVGHVFKWDPMFQFEVRNFRELLEKLDERYQDFDEDTETYKLLGPDGHGILGAAFSMLEAHREYIDVHVVLDGEEHFGWRPLADCAAVRQSYDPAADCALYADRPSSWLTLRPGQAAIVFPEDPHAPVVGEGRVRKLIGKIKLAAD